MSETLLTSFDQNTLVVSLNRPAHCNALTANMLDELVDLFVSITDRQDVHAVILTGIGASFCAGLELSEVQRFESDQQHRERMLGTLSELWQTVLSCPKPIIAAINGDAVAGGALLMSACDIVIASEQARVGYPAIHNGIAAGIVVPKLIAHVGPAPARQLLLTGILLQAIEAQKVGLISEVVKSADLMLRAKLVARQIGNHNPQTVASLKSWIVQAMTAHALDPTDFTYKFTSGRTRQ